MNEQERRNVDRIRALLDDADRGDEDLAARYYTDDYVDHHPSPMRALGRGAAGVDLAFRTFRGAFPDTEHRVHHLFGHDDRVVAHISATGTHTGELGGIAPTGKRVLLEAIAIYRMERERIAERWCFQGAGVLEQLRGAGE